MGKFENNDGAETVDVATDMAWAREAIAAMSDADQATVVAAMDDGLWAGMWGGSFRDPSGGAMA